LSDDVPSPAAAEAPSIRARLANALAAWVIAWGLAVGAAVWLAATSEVDELLDEALQTSGELLAGLMRSSERGLPAGEVAAPDTGTPTGHFAWQVVAADGRVAARSPRAPATAWRDTPSPGLFDTAQWRVNGVPLGAGGDTLYVAQSRTERREARAEVAQGVVLAAFAVGLLGHAWLRARVKVELRPLQSLSERLQAWDVDAPGALQPGALGTPERQELVPVHRAMTAATQQLAVRLANEQAFTAHAAHSLRTPLAGIDAQLAVALRDCPAPWRERVQQARDAAARLQGVVAALLGLFRSAQKLQLADVDLADLVHRLPAARLRVSVAPGLRLRADPDLLAAALLNLIDNAQRHGAGAVAIEARAPRGLVLHDDGPGVSAPRRALLQAAIDGQRYEGVTGLGLMLADRVARAHGGSLRLLEVARGFAVELQLGAA